MHCLSNRAVTTAWQQSLHLPWGFSVRSQFQRALTLGPESQMLNCFTLFLVPALPLVLVVSLWIPLSAQIRLRQFEAEQQKQCSLAGWPLILPPQSAPILVLQSTRGLAYYNNANYQQCNIVLWECTYQGPSSLKAQPPLHAQVPPKRLGKFSFGTCPSSSVW